MAKDYSSNPNLEVISNANGMTVTVMDWGATIVSIKVPVEGEGKREVLLGVEPENWSTQSCFFNATIGRFANRIANNEFTIDSVRYKLTSKTQHCLHGGDDGFDKRRFTLLNRSKSSLTYVLRSDDGDMGFPGNFELTVEFVLTDDNELSMHYIGRCDKKCWACITNHAYFNLNGHNSSVLNHLVWMDSDAFLPLDEGSIPTGEVRKVEGTAFDFRKEKTIGQDFRKDPQMLAALGYDHPFLIRGDLNKPFIKVTSDDQKLSLEVLTDYPAFQMYTGNYINENGSEIKARDDGLVYKNQSALCIEPEFYPNCPNMPQFDSVNEMVTPEKPLDRSIVYRFS
ncbi:MAG: galactose-1-epimerase [Succinivibrio sp.]